jgi:hypothetical protein
LTKARTNADNVTADIAGITAGTGITGGGTSGTVTVTNSMATAIDAAGDLIYGTGSDAFTRLGLGTASQILRVNSGATAPEWAAPAASGSMTLLSTTTLSGGTTTVSGISQAYKTLYIQIDEASVPSSNWQFSVIPNGSAVVDQSGQYGTTNYTQVGGGIKLFNGQGNSSGNDTSTFSIYINNYTDAFGYRVPFWFFGSYADNSLGLLGSYGGGCWRGNAAITSMDFVTSASTFSSGVARIYGVN